MDTKGYEGSYCGEACEESLISQMMEVIVYEELSCQWIRVQEEK